MNNRSAFANPQAALDHMHAVGNLYADATQGIQYDVVSVHKPNGDGTLTQASLCGFNCTKQKGGYNCSSATSLNQGVSKTTFAPSSFILERMAIAEAGLDLVRKWFIDEDLNRFCEQWQITDPNVKEALRTSFSTKRTEVNFFGGDSEQHTDIIGIIRGAKRMKMKGNLTATGGRWGDPAYVDALLEDPPAVVAVSYDAPSLTEFHQYSQMSVAELSHEMKRMDQEGDADYGQKKKAIAGIRAARILTDLPGGLPCTLLFNMVLHPGNIFDIDEIKTAVENRFPGSVLNPYPGHGSMNNDPVVTNVDYLREFRKFVKLAIRKTLAGGRFVKRLQYWIMLEAMFDYFGDEWDELARAADGHGVWTCFEEPMAGFYFQPAKSTIARAPLHQLSTKVVKREHVAGLPPPGGYPGCYWQSDTVTDNSRQIETPEQVFEHIIRNMRVLAAQSTNRCPGSLMPRLIFIIVSCLRGMAPHLRPRAIELRKQYQGF